MPSKAINKCIENGILADFLKDNKAEVLKMSIYEYDEAKHIQLERKESREEGQQEERQNSIKNLIEVCQDLNASEDDTVHRIMQIYTLSKNDAKKYITQYWKTNA